MNDSTERQPNRTDSFMEAYHYASGVIHRLAGDVSDERHRELGAYSVTPSRHDVVDDMVSNGFEEAVSREAVDALFDEEGL